MDLHDGLPHVQQTVNTVVNTEVDAHCNKLAKLVGQTSTIVNF